MTARDDVFDSALRVSHALDQAARQDATPDPNEDGITVRERVTRIGMQQNAWLHPEYTNRELRMLAAIGGLVEFAQDVLPVLARNGVHYTLMPEHLRAIAEEFGPWTET